MALLKIRASDLMWMKPSSLRSMGASPLWRRMVRREVTRMVDGSSLPSPLTAPYTGWFHFIFETFGSFVLSCSEMHV